jgi:hypothetical protein
MDPPNNSNVPPEELLLSQALAMAARKRQIDAFLASNLQQPSRPANLNQEGSNLLSQHLSMLNGRINAAAPPTPSQQQLVAKKPKLETPRDTVPDGTEDDVRFRE